MLFAAAAVALVVLRSKLFAPSRGCNWTKLRRRFRRPLPFCFLLLAALILVSGLLHAPNNDDALSYRIPRVLNWLAESRWHWVHTPHPAMNSHVVGTEWLLAPWLALTGTDRWVFPINFAAFLLLPGLVFSVFRGLGVSGSVAGYWMWLLPSGYNYLLQAGGDANDILGVVYALSAMHFALRARRSRNPAEAWFAIMAGALLTGCKLSNLPLLLPVALALLPASRLLLARPIATVAVFLAGITASVVPIAAINLHYCGDWTGTANEGKGAGGETGEKQTVLAGGTAAPLTYVFVVNQPWVGVSGNCLSLLCDNLFPPVFPMAGWWNAHNRDFFPASYRQKLAENFEPDFLRLRELPGEERAGLGFGVSWLLIAAWLAATLNRRNGAARSGNAGTLMDRATRWSPYFSLLFFMTKSGITAAARIVAPYYALLLPALLTGRGHDRFVRSRWSQRAGLLVYLLAFGVLSITPERPLWPAQTILARLEQGHPGNAQLQRARLVYQVYAERPDAFAPLREWLPVDADAVGMLCLGNEPSTSLWRPFRRHRVRQLFFSDSRQALGQWGISYIIARNTGPQFETWLKSVNGEVLGTKKLTFYASREPITWSVVRLGTKH